MLDQRDKGYRLDTLIQMALCLWPQVAIVGIGDQDRNRIGVIEEAGQLSIGQFAISLRETAPRLKAHDALLIKEQNRGAMHMQHTLKTRERQIVDLLNILSAVDRLTELIDHIQPFFCLFALSIFHR